MRLFFPKMKPPAIPGVEENVISVISVCRENAIFLSRGGVLRE
jgi:hypothetical protein